MSKFWIKPTDTQVEWKEIDDPYDHCVDSYDAAVLAGQNFYDNNPIEPSDLEFNVSVKDKDGNITNWVVTAEQTIDFHANEA